MKRSTLSLSFSLAFVVVAATFGCSSSSSGGKDAGGGSPGSGGNDTGSGGSGPGGSGGGTAGTTGTAGSSGTIGTAGSSGTTGTAGGGTAGNGGTGGGTAGAGGGNAGRGGNGGAGGSAGRGGSGGSNGGSAGGTAGSGGAIASITLTSTAFTEGTMMIPAPQTCAGTNVSPPLAWTAGPSGTMSYGIALVDMTNGYVHWTIWDMPPSTTSLPGSLPTTQVLTTPVMAQQINRFAGDGYSGPCPGTMTHTYVFEVYALDVATLPSVNPSLMPEMVRTQMIAHALAKGTLSGMAKTM
jgi:Raf kinase inhibitor-like YbhB/YbcL family protein